MLLPNTFVEVWKPEDYLSPVLLRDRPLCPEDEIISPCQGPLRRKSLFHDFNVPSDTNTLVISSSEHQSPNSSSSDTSQYVDTPLLTVSEGSWDTQSDCKNTSSPDGDHHAPRCGGTPVRAPLSTKRRTSPTSCFTATKASPRHDTLMTGAATCTLQPLRGLRSIPRASLPWPCQQCSQGFTQEKHLRYVQFHLVDGRKFDDRTLVV